MINESPKTINNNFTKRLEKLKCKYDGDLQRIDEDTNEFSLAQSRNSLALKTSNGKNPFFTNDPKSINTSSNKQTNVNANTAILAIGFNNNIYNERNADSKKSLENSSPHNLNIVTNENNSILSSKLYTPKGLEKIDMITRISPKDIFASACDVVLVSDCSSPEENKCDNTPNSKKSSYNFLSDDYCKNNNIYVKSGKKIIEKEIISDDFNSGRIKAFMKENSIVYDKPQKVLLPNSKILHQKKTTLQKSNKKPNYSNREFNHSTEKTSDEKTPNEFSFSNEQKTVNNFTSLIHQNFINNQADYVDAEKKGRKNVKSNKKEYAPNNLSSQKSFETKDNSKGKLIDNCIPKKTYETDINKENLIPSYHERNINLDKDNNYIKTINTSEGNKMYSQLKRQNSLTENNTKKINYLKNNGSQNCYATLMSNCSEKILKKKQSTPKIITEQPHSTKKILNNDSQKEDNSFLRNLKKFKDNKKEASANITNESLNHLSSLKYNDCAKSKENDSTENPKQNFNVIKNNNARGLVSDVYSNNKSLVSNRKTNPTNIPSKNESQINSLQRPPSKEQHTFKESIDNLNHRNYNLHYEKNPQVYSSNHINDNKMNYINDSKTNYESNSNNSTINFDASNRTICVKPENLCFTQAIENIKNKTMSFMQHEDDAQSLTDQEIHIIGSLKGKIMKQEEMLKGLVTKLVDLRKETEVYEQRFDVLLQENKQLNNNFKSLDGDYQMNKQIINELRSNFVNALIC